jgi:hypothetical protein
VELETPNTRACRKREYPDGIEAYKQQLEAYKQQLRRDLKMFYGKSKKNSGSPEVSRGGGES